MPAPVRHIAHGRWRDVLPALGIPEHHLTGRHCPCPVCGGTDRFRFDDKRGNGTWICSQCGAGDGVQLVMAVNGWSFAKSAKEVEAVLGGQVVSRPTEVAQVHERPLRSTEEAIRASWAFWEASADLSEGDPAWRYLRSRGVPYREDWHRHFLRYHPRANYIEAGEVEQLPALLAAVSAPNGEGVNILRTYLTRHGRKAPVRAPRKLMAGSFPAGSAARLGPVAPVMGIAEGLETAMSAAILYRLPVWSALNTAGLKRWMPPAETKEVHVFGDNDENHAGQAAAYELADRLKARGLTVRVHLPANAGEDWNDVLLRDQRRTA